MTEERSTVENFNYYLDHVTEIFNSTKYVCRDCKGCCCSGCFSSDGYFNNSEEERTLFVFTKKNYGFTKPRGFLTDSGCAIPRKYRSSICLRATCDKLRTRLANDFGVRLEGDILVSVVQDINCHTSFAGVIRAYVENVAEEFVKARLNIMKISTSLLGIGEL